MNKKNKLKAIIAFAVALAFIMPGVAVFANDEGISTCVDTIVSVDPATQTVEKDNLFDVEVYIEPGEPVCGVELFKIYYDASVITATGVTYEGFFDPYGTITMTPDLSVPGVITGICELTQKTETVNVSNVFCTISFTADHRGTSAIDIDANEAVIIRPDNSAVPLVVNDGEVIVTGDEFYILDISVDGSGTTDPIPGTHTYLEDTVVDMEATPDLGWSFDYWVGDVADPNSAITNITMSENKVVTAYFIESCYTLAVSIVGDGVVNVDPDKDCYLYGESVNLTAVPDSDWEFKEWSGDLSGNETHETIIMDDDKDVIATFIGDTIPPITICILDPPYPDGDNGWYTVPVKVTLDATDEGCGVSSTWYRWETPHYIWYADEPFIVSGDGIHTVEYFSIDRAGNLEDTKKCIIKIDTIPPVTTHKFDGLMGDSGWFISNVTVTLSARDVTSGVNYTMYKIDEGNWTNYNNTAFNVTEDGEYNISYYSVDLAGHKEINRTAILKIEKDLIPPETNHTFSGIMGKNDWYLSDVTVTLIAEDNAAGVATTYYKLDDDIEWTEYGYPFPVREDGNHTIVYYSVDKIGNEEDPCKPIEFKIDKTSPTIDLKAEDLGGNEWLLVATVSDETSGIDRVEFYVAGEHVGNATASPYECEITNPKKGDKAQAIAYDNAGNENISPPVDAVSQSQGQDAFIGWTFLIGWISNVEEAENIITAQAIRLRYIEVAPTGINVGLVKMTAVEFSSHNLLGRTLRSFGRMSLVIGIFKGEITIEDE